MLLPLYSDVLDDAMISSPRTRDSLPRTSSAMPSAKYSSVVAPWFSNGSTAMRLLPLAAAAPALPAFPALPAITVAPIAHSTSAAAPAITRLRGEKRRFGIASTAADTAFVVAGTTSVAPDVTAGDEPDDMPTCRMLSIAAMSASPVA